MLLVAQICFVRAYLLRFVEEDVVTAFRRRVCFRTLLSFVVIRPDVVVCGSFGAGIVI